MTPNNNDEKTGKDIPSGDGQVSDEAMDAVEGKTDDKPTGQDHSTEDHADQAPTEGVGAIQDGSTIRNDVADIDE
jgi:hypothetical protein